MAARQASRYELRQAARQAARQARVRKPTRLEALTTSVSQDFAHQHTVTINSRRRVLQFEATEVDRAIVALSADLANQRDRRSRIEATLQGLAAVVAKR